jgi:hypothetical protein
MKDGYYRNLLRLDREEDAVREPADECPTNLPVNTRKCLLRTACA